MEEKKYNVLLSQKDIETIMDSLDYMQEVYRATLLKLNVSKEEYFVSLNDMPQTHLYRDLLQLWTAIERGDVD